MENETESERLANQYRKEYKKIVCEGANTRERQGKLLCDGEKFRQMDQDGLQQEGLHRVKNKI